MNLKDKEETIQLMYTAIEQLKYINKLNLDVDTRQINERTFQNNMRTSLSVVIDHQVAMIHTLIDIIDRSPAYE